MIARDARPEGFGGGAIFSWLVIEVFDFMRNTKTGKATTKGREIPSIGPQLSPGSCVRHGANVFV